MLFFKGTNMILSDELVADFLPLARLTLGLHPQADLLKRPLAQLMAAASQGVGQLPRRFCPVPEDAPKEFIAVRGDMVLLPRFDAFRQRIRSQMETRRRFRGTPLSDPSVRTALDAILPIEQWKDPTTNALLFDNAYQRLAVAALVDAHLGVLTG
jgi:hypothetical protein